MTTLYIASAALLGAALGSFAGAQVWRLRAWQLCDDLRREAQLRKKKQRTVSEKEEYEVLRQENAAAKDERKSSRRCSNKSFGVTVHVVCHVGMN